MPGGKGDLARQAGKRIGSWHQTVEEVRRSQDVRRHGERARHDTKAPLCTEYVSLCVSCAIICCILDDCNREPCFTFFYLFQENESYGSKNPFAFILWCTRSRVGHSTE